MSIVQIYAQILLIGSARHWHSVLRKNGKIAIFVTMHFTAANSKQPANSVNRAFDIFDYQLRKVNKSCQISFAHELIAYGVYLDVVNDVILVVHIGGIERSSNLV